MDTPNIHAEEYDLVVLGSGAGGKLIAWTSAQKGQRVVVIERKYVGGSCPNIACLPTKNIIHSAKVGSFFFRSEEFGIRKDNVRIDMTAVRDRKRKMVNHRVDIHLENYQKSGAELVRARGDLSRPRRWRWNLPLEAPEGFAARMSSSIPEVAQRWTPFRVCPRQRH